MCSAVLLRHHPPIPPHIIQKSSPTESAACVTMATQPCSLMDSGSTERVSCHKLRDQGVARHSNHISILCMLRIAHQHSRQSFLLSCRSLNPLFPGNRKKHTHTHTRKEYLVQKATFIISCISLSKKPHAPADVDSSTTSHPECRFTPGQRGFLPMISSCPVQSTQAP